MSQVQGLLKPYIYMHIAVLAYGFTAILGALIHISPIALVWWRLVMTVATFVVLFRPGRTLFRSAKGHWPMIILTGIMITLHWICFYTSIKWSNASIAVVVLATMPAFTALLGPLVNKSRFEWYQLMIGILIIPGMALIVNQTSISMQDGIWVGILAAFLSSLFTVYNKGLVDIIPVKTLSLIQLSSGLIMLTLFLPVMKNVGWLESFMPAGMDWVYLILLSIFCTTLAFVLSSIALKSLTPYIINLTINLEPVYGVILAIIILKENKELNAGFYIGVCVILAAVFIYPLLKYKKTVSAI